jgi:hypothetical protein
MDTGLGFVIFKKREGSASLPRPRRVRDWRFKPKKDAKTTTIETARVHPASPLIVAENRSRRKYAAEIDTPTLWLKSVTDR